MSQQARIKRCQNLYNQFLNLTPRDFEYVLIGNFVEFDGLNFEEAKKTMRFILETFEGLNAIDAWDELSWNTYNSLEGILQSFLSSYTQFKNSPDQSTFQNLIPQLDSIAYHLRMFGIPNLAYGGAQIERTSAALNKELESITSIRVEIESLRNDVKNLIAPAVAGSLSKAFTQRKDILLIGRIVWGVIAFALGWYCINATYDFANTVGEALIVVKQPQPTSGNETIWFTVLMRSVVLLPLYAAFGFSFTQYKKERDFEEEYAHKAAVATSLPNYGDLTREPAVRDQIVTGATNVIFSTPTSRQPDTEHSEKFFGGIKEVIESLAKLLPGKG
jgi:hypothetical protein